MDTQAVAPDPTEVEQQDSTTTPEAPVEAQSIADHAKSFGPQKEATEQQERQAHHSDTQRREKETGRFDEGHKRVRKSKDAEQRIGALTGRAKTAEERVAELEAKLAKLESAPRQAVQPQPQAQPIQPQLTRQATGDPEPSENDPKYKGNYIAYLDDRARWNARQEYRAQRERDQQQASDRALFDAWGTRVNEVKGSYQDFDQVAFGEPVPWLDARGNPIGQAGAAIDSWIMQHKAGPHVLYYLQSHPQERDALLRKPILHVMEDLALLSQRFASNPSTQAGATGAVGGRQVNVVLPKPPTPVRTEAQRVGTVSPPTDGTLSISEHRKAFGSQRR